MEFIDLHIHLQDYKLNFATDIVKKAQKSGLKKMVCAGTSPDDWEQVAAWAREYPQTIVPAFGLHPWQVTKENSGWEEKLRGFLSAFPGSLVGETGLDGLKPDINLQRADFGRHLELAAELKRPLIIHAVRAWHLFNDVWPRLPEKFMFHSFNARPEQLREIIRRGGYVSFNASILRNRDFETIAAAVPADRILLESDGPYQPPVKGEVSTPFFIPLLLRRLAAARGCDEEELAQSVFHNSQEFINVG